VIPQNLPDYVDRGGEQVWRPPYTARDAEVFGFVLAADQTAIDALVRRDLVTPTLGACDYRCAHANVMVTFANIGRLASGDPRDELRGYLPEREVSVWCLVADVAGTGPTSRLLWYLPYVFTDSGQTVATGREVYGYPKQVGTFDANYPAALEGGGVTTVSGLSIDPFDPKQAASPRPMILADRSPGTGAVAAGASWAEEVAVWFPGSLSVNAGLPFGPQPQGSATITPANAPPPAGPSVLPPWVRAVLDQLEGRALRGTAEDMIADMAAGGRPTLVFLKQFRDVECPTKACYQAVVEAPISIDPVGARYEALDPGLFRITIEDWASQPIASELGIAAGQPLTPERAFHAEFSFDIQVGLEVWRAPT
jgi:hypothetical protein